MVEHRSWDDYSLGRALTGEHLGALDLVYSGVIGDHRAAIQEFEELDPVTQDLLIGQTEQLEQFQWFIRAHLEDKGGSLTTAGAEHEEQAAAQSAGQS